VAEGTCGECGGELIGPVALEVVAGGDSGELQTKVMATSGIVRRPTRSAVSAMVCTGCGRMDLRTDPAEIAERWRQGDR
jgi:hypothetical protein